MLRLAPLGNRFVPVLHLSLAIAATCALVGCDATSTTSESASTETAVAEAPEVASPDTPNKPNEAEGTVALPGSEASGSRKATLGVGDVAPALNLGGWVKGQPISQFEKGKVYVVEFWATWCGPCRQTMPHLSQLQSNFGDRVEIVGISSEDEATVSNFLSRPQNPNSATTWDEVVTYRLALDPNREMSAAYMQAAGQNGIPTAFIVGQEGHVEWIGHPLRMDAPLQQIVAGTWDRTAAAEQFSAQNAEKLAAASLQLALQRAQQSGNFEPAIEALDQFLAAYPSQSQHKLLMFQLLIRAGKPDRAASVVDEFATEHWDNGRALDAAAWMMATELPAEHRDLDRALEVALRGSTLQDDSNASALDTTARVFFERGDIEQAVAYQTRAVALDGENKELQKQLEKYQAANDE